MEERKIKVGITHGDINGIGYEVILKAFADPVMLELCTPVIYGSPKVAAYHRKAMDIQTNFSIVPSAAEAQDGRVNIVNCTADELKVEIHGRMVLRSATGVWSSPLAIARPWLMDLEST